MKKLIIGIILCYIPAFWQMAPVQKLKETETDTVLLGDIDRDNSIDTAYVSHPKWISEDEFYGDCHDGACSVNITFSFKAPPLHHDDSVEAWVKSIGDIDEDGVDEIVVATGWFIGCRGNRHFYSLKKGKWQLIGKTYYFNCLADGKEFDPDVKKTARGQFETPTLEFSEDEGDEITVIKTFIIKK